MAEEDKNTLPENNPEDPEEKEDASKEESSEEKEDASKEESSEETDKTSNSVQQQIGDSRVHDRTIEEEMSDSYLNYAMSVIVSRALPDVRDGLKPVHRRILYSMHKQGLRHTARFSKSARTVGDVIAKYHPHGDQAVYASLVRMAQDFSMRYPLIRGQGNFGSIDGDPAAAFRYTEAKMEKISDEMLADIEKETVQFRPNYDDTIQEPSVLPAMIPNLLLNGTVGIAVGMATNIPPHNLREVVDGVLLLTENEDATIDDLMKHIKGPDFPTAGEIYDVEAIKNAYATGRGSLPVRGKAKIEEMKDDKFRVIITELPYQVNKALLITKMAELVRDKKIVGISDIRDESSSKNNEQVRIVVDLKKGAYPKKILNQFYKFTSLQTSFGMNMIALVDGGLQPRLLNLKAILEHFIEHRKEVITNRVKYELKITKARVHILEGLKIALDNIDAVIKLIRASETKELAKEGLMKEFKLSELQADAILQMRLQTLAGLERKRIEDELKEKLDFIKKCEDILKDPKKIIKIMKDELIEIKNKFGDDRRTEVFEHAIGKFKATDTIPDEPMMVALSMENYIKRLTPDTFRAQHRGGKGIIGMGTKDEDTIVNVLFTKNHNNILYFTNKGRVFQLPVYEIPKASRQSKGQAIVNLLQLGDGEIVTAMLNVEAFQGEYLMMATKFGTVKKTKVDSFAHVRKSGLIAIKLRDGDELKWVTETSGEDQIILMTKKGKCIRFSEKNVRSMGRNSTGVRGIRLKSNEDAVVRMDVITDVRQANVMVVMENGLGKISRLSEYRLQSRGGSGVKAANITKKTGNIIAGKVLYPETTGDILCFSRNGQTLRTDLKSMPMRGRATQGVIIMRLKENDKLASVSLITEHHKESAEKSEEEQKGTQPKLELKKTEEKNEDKKEEKKDNLKDEEKNIKKNDPKNEKEEKDDEEDEITIHSEIGE